MMSSAYKLPQNKSQNDHQGHSCSGPQPWFRTSRPWLLLAHSAPATLTPLVSFKPASPTPGLSESEVLFAQSCPTVCNPMDCSPPGSSVHGILQARILEWVAIFFSNACKWKVKVKSLSRVRHFATPWSAAYQAPPSMGFSRQQFWSGVPSI